MAKRSRRSRRARIAQTSKTAQPPKAVQPSKAAQPAPKANGTASATAAGNGVDFTADYAYVYTEMRTMALVTLVMAAAIFGLSYII